MSYIHNTVNKLYSNHLEGADVEGEISAWSMFVILGDTFNHRFVTLDDGASEYFTQSLIVVVVVVVDSLLPKVVLYGF